MLENLAYVVDNIFPNWYTLANLQNERGRLMGEKELHQSMSVSLVGTVVKLIGLSVRQIRYYEEQDLVHPERSERNRCIYSLSSIGMLLEAKDYLSDRLDVAGIKCVYEMAQVRKQETKNEKPLTSHDVRQIFRNEISAQSELNKTGHYQSQGLQRQFSN